MTRRLTPMALAELSNFVKAHTPDPHRELLDSLKGLEPDVARMVFEVKESRLPEWPPRDGSPEYMKTLLGTPGGLGLVIYHALRRANTWITRETANEIAQDVEFDEIQTLFDVIMPDIEAKSESGTVPPSGPDRDTNDTGPSSA